MTMPQWTIPVIIVTVIVSFQFTIILLAILNKDNPAVMAKLISIEETLANIVSGDISKPKE